MGELRIYVKQTQLFNAQGQPVYYSGSNPANLTVNNGSVPVPRQWPNFGNYRDVSGEVGNIQELSLTWSQDRDNYGVSAPGIFQVKKSTSGTLQIEGNLYLNLKAWLIDDISATLNKVDVKIHDVGCNIWYEDYEISNEDIIYCEGEICQFDVTLRQKDEMLNCIKRTMISDNWQGWFPINGRPENGKQHPRFSYCNEIRPNGGLTAIWILGVITFTITNLIIITLIPIINIIIGIIKVVLTIVQFIVNLVGGNNPPDPDSVDFIRWDDVRDTQKESFVESAGCGREHPAPLIRDYIKNVCDKCGVKVDGNSAPIFFNPTQAVPFTASGIQDEINFHYNACYFNAPYKRGIRRVASVGSLFRVPDFNDTDFWIDDNKPLLTLDMFLDKLKGVYNSEWRVTNGTLYFQRKDYFLSTNYIFDFSKNAADRALLLQGVCFEWNQLKYPAYTSGLYATDDSDKCGNEALSFMNDLVSHGSTLQNPNLEGTLDKMQQFGGTRFRLDGITPDYIADACLASQTGLTFVVGIFGGTKGIMERISEVADYALLLNEETATLPKIMLWDGVSMLGARCYKLKSASGLTPPFPLPTINTNYNAGRQWFFKHEFNTFVKGQNGVAGSFPIGYYTVRNLVGTLIYQQPGILVNYPMYMDSEFQGTMWDLFHFVDDPVKYPAAQQSWSAKITLCCDNIKKLGVENAATNIVIGQKVKLDRNYYPDGKIKEITLNYDPTNEYGAHIELKGD